jgi:hypothetical protein
MPTAHRRECGGKEDRAARNTTSRSAQPPAPVHGLAGARRQSASRRGTFSLPVFPTLSSRATPLSRFFPPGPKADSRPWAIARPERPRLAGPSLVQPIQALIGQRVDVRTPGLTSPATGRRAARRPALGGGATRASSHHIRSGPATGGRPARRCNGRRHHFSPKYDARPVAGSRVTLRSSLPWLTWAVPGCSRARAPARPASGRSIHPPASSHPSATPRDHSPTRLHRACGVGRTRPFDRPALRSPP